jgi:hypothetical protein
MPVCKQCEADGNLGRTCLHIGTWDLPGITHWDGCGNSDRPEHKGCKKRPDVLPESTLWEEGYSIGVQDSMLRATQYERVLTDLIADLRANAEGHAGNWLDCVDEQRTMADRAEARLREVGGGE